MIKRVIALICLILGIAIFIPIQRGQADSFVQPAYGSRSPQILRDLASQGNPQSRYLPIETKPAVLLPSPELPADFPTWSRLVFQSYRGYKWKLYTSQPDATDESMIYAGEGANLFPKFQTNGQQVVFVNNGSGNYEIFSLESNGANPRQLTDHSATDTLPVWSPNGNVIAFQSTRAGNSDIYVIDPWGNGIVALTDSPAYDGEPTWSPDGTRIAFVSNRSGNYDLWVMNADGSEPHAITSGLVAMGPDWSPKGDQIAFAHDSDGNNFFEIWLVDIEGSNLKKMDYYGYDNDTDAWAPSWSPDGEWLAFITTDWILYQGSWYWTSSMYHLKQISPIGELWSPSTDNLVWRADWAANDPLSPGDCSVTPASQPWWGDVPVRFTAADAGEAGIAAYDAQFREPGGDWQDLVRWIRSDGAVYPASEAETVEIRCRAYDRAGNVGGWSANSALLTDFDSLPPVSQTTSESNLIRGTQAELSWTGIDEDTGIAGYNIYVKDGTHGDWDLWLAGAVNNHGEYWGESGHTYFFRSQAQDQAGHTEPWQPGSQTWMTFYSTTLTVTVTDMRGYGVPGASVTMVPTATYTIPGAALDAAQYYLRDQDTHTLNVTSPGFGSLPTATIPTSQDSGFLWVLTPEENLIINGGFESPLTAGWLITGTGASISGEGGHSGNSGLSVSHTLTDTTILTQALNLDAGFQHPTLSFLYRVPVELTGGGFEIRVENTFSNTQPVLLSLPAQKEEWKLAWADLSGFSGQAITLTLSLSRSQGSVLVDEISIGEWATPIVRGIAPHEWWLDQSTSVVITGENFLPTSTLSLGDYPLTSIDWISATQIQAVAPAINQGGDYDLVIRNPGGQSSVLRNAVNILAKTNYLPIALKNGPVREMSYSAGWPMFGHNPARTGYNESEPGASRYSLAWSKDNISGICYGTLPFAVAEGVVLMPSPCGSSVVAFDAQTGAERWRYSVNGYSNVPIYANGLVYFGTSQSLHGLNPRDGSEAWGAAVGNDLLPLVAEHRVFNTYSDGFKSRNAATGSFDWEKLIYISNFFGGALAYDQGVLYSWINGVFRVSNPQTGGVYWSLEIAPHYVGNSGEVPVVSGRMAFVGLSPSARIYAINLDTRQIQWTGDLQSSQYSVGPYMAVADGVVYAVSGALSAFDLETGDLLWSFVGDGELIWNPIITQKYIYLSSNGMSGLQPHTYVLDRETHEVVWEIDQGGYIAVANGYLYIATTDAYHHELLAYRAQEP